MEEKEEEAKKGDPQAHPHQDQMIEREAEEAKEGEAEGISRHGKDVTLIGFPFLLEREERRGEGKRRESEGQKGKKREDDPLEDLIRKSLGGKEFPQEAKPHSHGFSFLVPIDRGLEDGKQNGEGVVYNPKEDRWEKGYWNEGRRVQWFR